MLYVLRYASVLLNILLDFGYRPQALLDRLGPLHELSKTGVAVLDEEIVNLLKT